MATEPKPASRPVIELAPPAGRGERWWPVALAIIVVAGLHVVLPARLARHLAVAASRSGPGVSLPAAS